MVLLRRCAAGLLFTAGSLGLLSSVGAAPPQPAGVRLVGPLKATPGQLRLEAMKVEMAWLADMATYGLPLEVHVQGDALCACGRVPDEAGRQLVMEVARQACCVPVADGLTVAQRGAARPADPKALEAAARAALRQHLAEGVALTASADEHGMVTVRGEVATVEDKLAASQCLKGLAGCTAVTNAVAVTPVRHAGHTVTVVTRDGQLAVHGALPGAAEVKPNLVVMKTEPTAPALLSAPAQPSPAPYVLPPAPTVPSGLPADRPRVKVVRAGQAEEVRPIRYVNASGYVWTPDTRGYPGLESKSQGIHVQVVQPESRPSLWERLTSFRRSRRAPEVVTPAPKDEQPTVTVTPVGATPAVAPAPAQQSVTWPKAQAAAPAEMPEPKPVSRPLAHLIRVSTKLKGKAEPTMVEPVKVEAVKVEPAKMEAVHVDPVKQTSAPAMMPAVMPEVRQAAKVETKPAPATMTPPEVMKVVQEHCGPLAREVQVEAPKEGGTVVKVYAPSENEQALVGRLLGLPALGPGVKVQVVLGQ